MGSMSRNTFNSLPLLVLRDSALLLLKSRELFISLKQGED